jgi:succinoglycan biosynthesis protein ExoL
MPVGTDARMLRRVQALVNNGISATSLAFERPYYETKEKAYTPLGKIEHGNYFKRLSPFIKALPTIRNHAKSHTNLYCFGLDMLLLAWLSQTTLRRPINLFYEVADIREIMFGNDIKAKLMRQLETFLVRRSKCLVLTSQAYYDHYYQNVLKLKPTYHIIENKLEPADLVAQSNTPTPTSYRFGYFGLLRCRQTWRIMQKLAEQGTPVYVRGFPRSPLSQEDLDNAKTLAKLHYGGPYVAPNELPEMYGKVDIVWAAYPYEADRKTQNWRWARTHRFYEACCFGKPMIVQKGTEDARVVEACNIGLSLDLTDPEAAVKTLQAITPEQLASWTKNIKALPKHMYLYSDEHAKLADYLRSSSAIPPRT